MAEQDLIPAARGAVDAFNASDWEGYKAAMTSDCVYDEVGTSRILRGVDEIIRCFQEWKQAMPDVRVSFSGIGSALNSATNVREADATTQKSSMLIRTRREQRDRAVRFYGLGLNIEHTANVENQ